MSIPAATVLVWYVAGRFSSEIQIGCLAYAVSLVGLYTASTLSHLFHDLHWRRFYRTVDQALIFTLIAGSFTPWAVLYLKEGWWTWLLPGMWLAAALGVVFSFRTREFRPPVKIGMYVLFGWIPATSLWVVFAEAPRVSLDWLIAGGVCYTLGTIFLLNDHRMKYLHAVWHLFVIAGSACHYVAIMTMLDAV